MASYTAFRHRLTLVLIPTPHVFPPPLLETLTDSDRWIERGVSWALTGFQAANDDLMPRFIEQSRGVARTLGRIPFRRKDSVQHRAQLAVGPTSQKIAHIYDSPARN